MSKHLYFAEQAYLVGGWANDVRIECVDGTITKLTPDTTPDGAIILSGPTLSTIANLHSHAFQRAMAGLAEVNLNPADSFWSWRDLMYKMVRKLSPNDVRIIAKQLYIDMIKAGYTQVAEFHYLHHNHNGKPYNQLNEMAQQLIQAADEAGLGLTLLPVLYSYSGFGAQAPSQGQSRFINSSDQYLKLHQDCEQRIAANTKHRLGVCFHSLRATTGNQIREVLEATDKNVPVHIHIAEQQKEVDDCLTWSGQRPVQWLDNEIGLTDRWCLVHATHLSQSEMQSIADAEAIVGLCPTTEANLGDGIFPATDFINTGGHWGIGSDSHVSLSIVEELRTLEYGQRLRDQQRNRLYDAQQNHIGDFLYAQALDGGNRATQVKLGLAVGNRADFLVLDHQHPFIGASKNQDIFNRWLFACNENVIRHVYIAAKPVVIDFNHAEQASANEAFTQLLKRLFQ